MIGPGTGVRVYLACGATDIRQKMDHNSQATLIVAWDRLISIDPKASPEFSYRQKARHRNRPSEAISSARARRRCKSELAFCGRQGADGSPLWADAIGDALPEDSHGWQTRNQCYNRTSDLSRPSLLSSAKKFRWNRAEHRR